MTEFDRDIVFAPTKVDDPGEPNERLLRFRRKCKKCKGEWTSKKTATDGDLYFFWFGGSTQAVVGLGLVKGKPKRYGKPKQWDCNFDPLVLLHAPIRKEQITDDPILAKWWKSKPFHGWPKHLPENVVKQFFALSLAGNYQQRTILKRLLTTNSLPNGDNEDGRDLGRLCKAAGFESDPKVRRAIETRAMKKAEEYLRGKYPRYRIEDVHKKRSYDFECRSSTKKYFVEVKGTRNLGKTITLTAKEVRFAQNNAPNMILCVVHSIILSGGKKPKAKDGSGTLVVYDNWAPDRDKLETLAYRYKL